MVTQGKGIYMGMAFWPGGTIADWGIISETVANATAPLYPCDTTNNWNSTGLSDQAYLVRATATCASHCQGLQFIIVKFTPVRTYWWFTMHAG